MEWWQHTVNYALFMVALVSVAREAFKLSKQIHKDAEELGTAKARVREAVAIIIRQDRQLREATRGRELTVQLERVLNETQEQLERWEAPEKEEKKWN